MVVEVRHGLDAALRAALARRFWSSPAVRCRLLALDHAASSRATSAADQAMAPRAAKDVNANGRVGSGFDAERPLRRR